MRTGGTALGAITALVLDRPICVRCIALKAGVTTEDVEEVVPKIAAAVRLYRGVTHCRACDGVADVLSMDRPQAASSRAVP